MTVKDFMATLDSEHTAILIDSDTCNELDEISPNDPWDERCEWEVTEISGRRCDAIGIFVKRPAKKYRAPLDITYTTWVEIEVPSGEDKGEYFEKEAEKFLRLVPSGFAISGGHCFEYLDDNVQTGGYYDMITEV